MIEFFNPQWAKFIGVQDTTPYEEMNKRVLHKDAIYDNLLGRYGEEMSKSVADITYGSDEVTKLNQAIQQELGIMAEDFQRTKDTQQARANLLKFRSSLSQNPILQQIEGNREAAKMYQQRLSQDPNAITASTLGYTSWNPNSNTRLSDYYNAFLPSADFNQYMDKSFVNFLKADGKEAIYNNVKTGWEGILLALKERDYNVINKYADSLVNEMPLELQHLLVKNGVVNAEKINPNFAKLNPEAPNQLTSEDKENIKNFIINQISDNAAKIQYSKTTTNPINEGGRGGGGGDDFDLEEELLTLTQTNFNKDKDTYITASLDAYNNNQNAFSSLASYFANPSNPQLIKFTQKLQTLGIEEEKIKEIQQAYLKLNQAQQFAINEGKTLPSENYKNFNLLINGILLDDRITNENKNELLFYASDINDALENYMRNEDKFKIFEDAYIDAYRNTYNNEEVQKISNKIFDSQIKLSESKYEFLNFLSSKEVGRNSNFIKEIKDYFDKIEENLPQRTSEFVEEIENIFNNNSITFEGFFKNNLFENFGIINSKPAGLISTKADFFDLRKKKEKVKDVHKKALDKAVKENIAQKIINVAISNKGDKNSPFVKLENKFKEIFTDKEIAQLFELEEIPIENTTDINDLKGWINFEGAIKSMDKDFGKDIEKQPELVDVDLIAFDVGTEDLPMLALKYKDEKGRMATRYVEIKDNFLVGSTSNLFKKATAELLGSGDNQMVAVGENFAFTLLTDKPTKQFISILNGIVENRPKNFPLNNKEGNKITDLTVTRDGDNFILENTSMQGTKITARGINDLRQKIAKILLQEYASQGGGSQSQGKPQVGQRK